MSRDIEFRIVKDGKIYGYERVKDGCWEWMVLELNPDKGERWTPGVILPFPGIIREQFTGLTDKAGVKVFEGDIVRCGTVGTIKFEGGRFLYDYTHPEDPEQLDVHEIIMGEVIGNIHQHKDLLK